MHKTTLISFHRVVSLELLGRNMSCEVKALEVGHTRTGPAVKGGEGLMSALGGYTPPHVK